MKAWVARDDNGICLFLHRPYKLRDGWANLVYEDYGAHISAKELPPDINPQWEDDEPIEVEISITKVKKQ